MQAPPARFSAAFPRERSLPASPTPFEIRLAAHFGLVREYLPHRSPTADRGDHADVPRATAFFPRGDKCVAAIHAGTRSARNAGVCKRQDRCRALCLGLVLTSAVWAQLPTAQLTNIFPPGGKVGTTFDVELAGTDLDDAGQLIFSHPGITAVQKSGAPTPFAKAPPPLPRQFTVTVAAAVPAGVYEVRTVGRYGASNPRAFSVGTLNESVVKDPPSIAAKAKLVPLETVVDAAARPEQADYYKFTARKGQRVLIDCWARRIDSRLRCCADSVRRRRTRTGPQQGARSSRSVRRFSRAGRRLLRAADLRLFIQRRG